jgi:hypothetical protein
LLLKLVGLAETERGDWRVHLMQVELGRIDAELAIRGTNTVRSARAVSRSLDSLPLLSRLSALLSIRIPAVRRIEHRSMRPRQQGLHALDNAWQESYVATSRGWQGEASDPQACRRALPPRQPLYTLARPAGQSP